MISTVQPLATSDPSCQWVFPCRHNQPHIYSPSQTCTVLPSSMHPHPHSYSPDTSSSHQDMFTYYDWCSPKGDVSCPPYSGPWSTYFRQRRSPESNTTVMAVNPKVTILSSQQFPDSDVGTPSSASSYSVPTPLSPFGPDQICDFRTQEDIEIDGFEYDDDDDEDIDSDFPEDMDMGDEGDDGQLPFYAASASHATKSTSALQGALGDAHSSHYDAYHPANRKMSASVPGYASASHLATSTESHQPQQRWSDSEPSPNNSLSEPSNASPSQQLYTHHHHHHDYSSSASSFAPASPIMYQQSTSSALAGALASFVYPSNSTPPTLNRLPIMQPQPIRAIPPIPLDELTLGADDDSIDSCGEPQRPETLSSLPLLCQPVSDAIRYQLNEPSADGRLDATYTGMTENNRFAHEELAYNSRSVPSDHGQMDPYGCISFASGWR